MTSPRVIFTAHAEQRMTDRGVDRATLTAMIASPTISGPADGAQDDRTRWAAGSVMVQTHREWMTAIYVEEDGELVVLTTYPGPPSRTRTTAAARKANDGRA